MINRKLALLAGTVLLGSLAVGGVLWTRRRAQPSIALPSSANGLPEGKRSGKTFGVREAPTRQPENSSAANTSYSEKEPLSSETLGRYAGKIAEHPAEIREKVAIIAKANGSLARIQDMSQQMEQQLELIFQDQEGDADELAEAKALIESEFNPEAMIQEYLQELADSLSAEELDRIADFYESPAGRTYVEASNRMQQLGSDSDKLREFGEFVASGGGSEKEQLQAKALNAHLGVDEGLVHMAAAIARETGENLDEGSLEYAELVKYSREQSEKSLAYMARELGSEETDNVIKAMAAAGGSLRREQAIGNRIAARRSASMLSKRNEAATGDDPSP